MKIVQMLKRKNLALLVPVLTILAMALVGCSSNSGGGSSSNGSSTPLAETMVTVPTNGSTTITFPTGTSNNGSGTINHKFALAKTEVTYELWKKVYNWASTTQGSCVSATGQYCYTFANAGKEGQDGAVGAAPTAAKNEPVTTVSWRDSIVWSNAYTEWYNAEKGGSLTVVYKKSGTPLRDATNGADVDGLGGTFDPTSNTATGFRLPTSQEWEYAARLRTDATNAVASNTPSGVTYPISIGGTSYWFTKGNSASGAPKSITDATETGKFAWYNLNSAVGSVYKTHDVAGKTANALGIYDMSGNVWEWCFDIHSGSGRVYRGGSWYNGASYLQVGYVGMNSAGSSLSTIGFRVVRTQ